MLGQCAEDSSESSNTLKTLMISYQWSGITLTNHGFLCSYFWYMSSLIRSTSRSRALIHINTALQWGDPATHSVHSINLIIRTWNILLMKRIVSTYLGCSTTLCLTSPFWLLIFMFYRNILSFISFTTLWFSRVFIRTCWQVEDRDGTEVDLPVTDELTERRLCSVVSQSVSVIRPLSGPNNWACAGVIPPHLQSPGETRWQETLCWSQSPGFIIKLMHFQWLRSAQRIDGENNGNSYNDDEVSSSALGLKSVSSSQCPN